MAKTPREVHVIVKPDTSKLDEALANLQAAEARYRALVSGELDCPSWWEGDPPGPDYPGTRCQLLGGHVELDGTRHRHRVIGSQVTLEWD